MLRDAVSKTIQHVFLSDESRESFRSACSTSGNQAESTDASAGLEKLTKSAEELALSRVEAWMSQRRLTDKMDIVDTLSVCTGFQHSDENAVPLPNSHMPFNALAKAQVASKNAELEKLKLLLAERETRLASARNEATDTIQRTSAMAQSIEKFSNDTGNALKAAQETQG